MGLTVGRVATEATADLRRRVLRPDAPPGAAAMSAGWPDDAVTFAACDGPTPLSTVTVMPEPHPAADSVAAFGHWRLRGMATDPARRGRGLGRAVLDAAVAHVGEAGADLLWCNARSGAIGFYERAGFVGEGDEFDIEYIGVHRRMVLPIGSGRPRTHGAPEAT